MWYLLPNGGLCKYKRLRYYLSDTQQQALGAVKHIVGPKATEGDFVIHSVMSGGEAPLFLPTVFWAGGFVPKDGASSLFVAVVVPNTVSRKYGVVTRHR